MVRTLPQEAAAVSCCKQQCPCVGAYGANGQITVCDKWCARPKRRKNEAVAATYDNGRDVPGCTKATGGVMAWRVVKRGQHLDLGGRADRDRLRQVWNSKFEIRSLPQALIPRHQAWFPLNVGKDESVGTLPRRQIRPANDAHVNGGPVCWCLLASRHRLSRGLAGLQRSLKRIRKSVARGASSRCQVVQ